MNDQPSPAASIPGRPLSIISWVFQIGIAGLFAMFAVQKFQYVPDTQAIFENIGGHPAAIASGVFELLAAVLLLVPRTAAIGAGLSVVAMLGAIGAHLGPVGMAPVNPETGEANGSLFFMAIGVLVLSLAILIIRRRSVLALLPGRRAAE
ncbi:MAG: LPXTG cell wall anchor domain-containing protein [Planctomycetota bacterium]